MQKAKVGDVVRVRGRRGRWIVLDISASRIRADLYELKAEWPNGSHQMFYRPQFRVLRGGNAANFSTTPKELLAALRPAPRRATV